MNILRHGSEELRRWTSAMEARREESDQRTSRVAGEILEAVKAGGDAAVAQLVERLDHESIPPRELLIAPGTLSIEADLAAALTLAWERIAAFHRPQMLRGYRIEESCATLEQDVLPLRRVGIYVPGGSATYISTLLMCAIPARIAGVAELVVATPPRSAASAELQWVCQLLGIREIFRAGGAVAIAAMTFGTESLRRVDKIVGPGNAYVAAAKQLVATRVGVDLIAGPSEIVVLADQSADAELVAADLLAQAEHGADSSPICVTTSMNFALELQQALRAQLSAAEQFPVAMTDNGAIIVVRDLADAAALINQLAPEHLEIQIDQPESVLAAVENCAAIYVGASSGVALGDYVVGTNHVLPTAGSARFSSPLGVYDFVKRRSVVRLGTSAAAALGRPAELLAQVEGLPLHARSSALRVAGAVRSSR